MPRIKKFINHHWGILVLFTITLVIASININPNEYLMGWDNFSTYLNNNINLTRTIFSTWREYRGLGVASDSEITDLPRQLFYLFTSSFLKIQLLDQIYVFFNFILGVLGTYLLTKFIIKESFPKLKLFLLEATAFVSGIWYIFNLNTLATFFFPMPMYVVRFALLPWIIYAFLININQKKLSPPHILLLFTVSLLGLPAYLTATIFVTIILLLMVISISIPKKIIRNLLITGGFVLINSCWLINFANYTLQKSFLLPQTSTFIDVNEIKLNEPSNHYSFDKIITLIPNFFFTTSPTDISTNQPINLHPNINNYLNNPLTKGVLYLLPIISFLGLLSIIIRFKQSYSRWIPIVVFGCIFMLQKDNPPFGFIYIWLSQHIPLLNILFRFADTKFNGILALALIVSAAHAIAILFIFLEKIHFSYPTIKKYAFSITLILSILLIITFPQFFLKKFISPLVFTTIPNSYQEIADYINNDPNLFRVMHLPFDNLSYWKPYSWGYFGSNFFAFLIDKPMFDRTFTPASLENDAVDQILMDLSNQIAQSENEPGALEKISNHFYTLLLNTNTKYIIFDETVNPEVTAKNTKYWGDFRTQNLNQLISSLINNHKLILTKEFTINQEKNNKIYLYQIDKANPPAQILSSATNVSSLNNPISLYKYQELDNDYIQTNQEKSGIIFPLTGINSTEAQIDNSDQYTISGIDKFPIPINIFSSLKDNHLIISINKNNPTQPINQLGNNQEISFTLNQPLTLSKNYYLSDWHIINQPLSQYRMQINDINIPIPYNTTNAPAYITSVIVDSPTIDVKLLAPDNAIKYSSNNFVFTDNPNCFNDKQSDYSSKIEKDDSNFTVSTKNGTSCVIADYKTPKNTPYLETQFTFSMHPPSIDKIVPIDYYSPFHSITHQVISKLPIASYFTVCLRNPNTDSCLNNHIAVKSTSPTTLVVPTVTPPPPNTQLYFSLPYLNQQQASLQIANITITPYKTADSTQITLLDSNETPINSNKIQFNLPQTLGSDSFYFNPVIDALRVFNEPCINPNQYRTSRTVQNTLLQYTNGCTAGTYERLPLIPSHTYLWQTDYSLLSGKYPKFQIIKNNITYINQILSLNQGYPNLSGFKTLQTSTPPFTSNSQIENNILQTLNNPTFHQASTYINTENQSTDPNLVNFTIMQDSENQGIVLIKNFTVTPLPKQWHQLALIPQTSNQSYTPSQIVSAEKIIPSLWRITLKLPKSQPTLLTLSQAYDAQWQLFQSNSPVNVLFNKNPIIAKHVKVNSFINGWIIDPQNLTNNQEEITLYALYTPERFTLIGWFITLTTIGSVALLDITMLLSSRVRGFRKP